MKIRSRIFARSRRAEPGQGMVEYALLLALIAVVVVAILATLGDRNGPVGQTFDRVTDTDKGNLSRGKPAEYAPDTLPVLPAAPALPPVPARPPTATPTPVSNWVSVDDTTYLTVAYVPLFADPAFSLN